MYVLVSRVLPSFIFFFFNDTATTEIYTLSLHDALPIYDWIAKLGVAKIMKTLARAALSFETCVFTFGDRKSTRLNSSHDQISYAVFCLKKKKNHQCDPTHDLLVVDRVRLIGVPR